ncbi:RagB/SusD family nutrient uptake outer membrane protein [Chitinophagaceae bacterium LWZ2-11]
MKILETIHTKFLAAGLLFLAAGCSKSLDQKPYVQVTSETVYSSPANIKSALAKLYAGLSLSGQDATTYPDINTQDVGSNVFLRVYWEAQELTTDEAVIGWNDHDLLAYHNMNWTANGYFNQIMYDRVYFEIAACNEFIRQTAGKSFSGFSAQDIANIKVYTNEARYLRAFAYWVAIDLYGNVPFVTENDGVGAYFPKQIQRKDLFTYLETELLDLQNVLPDPGQTDYGRADKGAAWMLLAKLYLNANVYTGTAKNTEAITYCNKIINSNKYALASKYSNLFKTDNNLTKEIIFPIAADGISSQSYGNTTFLVHAEVGGNMNTNTQPYGIAAGGGWSGMRTTKAFVNLFSDPTGNTDQRAIFYTNGQTLEIINISNFGDGYAVPKFINLSSTGQQGSDPTGTFVDTDFPLFRLADVYLMYAEAVLRGGSGGDQTTALNYVNLLRQRAYGNTNGNIASGALTLDFILAERGRELYWEAQRRTDLIRFGKFTDASYLWPYKGGVPAGTGVDAKYNLFPLSATDLIANPNLIQTKGY